MRKFSFSEKKNMLIPNSPLLRPFYDKNGKELSGDEMIHIMANICNKWTKKTKVPVPIPEQKFIAWVKQASKMLNEGIKSEEIFKQTIIGGTL